MKRGRIIMVTAGLAVALGAVGVWAWQAEGRRAIVAEHLPAPMEVGARSPEFGAVVATAEERARSLASSVDGLEELARLLHANGFFDEALSCYEGLQRVKPRDVRWPHLAATILASYGRLEEAEPLYRQAVALGSHHRPPRLRLGEVLLKGNRVAEAAEVYGEVLARWPDEPYALLGLARCAIASGEWGKAREHLQRAIAADAEFVGGLSLLVTVLEHFGETDEAAALRGRIGRREFVDLPDAWVDGLVEDCFDPYQLSVSAAVALARGDDATAIRLLERAIGLSENPAPYYRQLGKLLLGNGDLAAARSRLEQALALAPKDADAWVLLVNLLNASRSRGEAYRRVAAGIEQCPDSWALHFAHGKMLNEDGRLGAAIVELEEAKRLRASEVNPYIELALARFKLGEIEAGMVEMREALVVQPDHPMALVMMARNAISEGNQTAAQDWIRRIRKQTRIERNDLEMVLREFQRRFAQAPE